MVNPLVLATLPLTLVHQLESLFGQLGQVATRASGLLDVAEPVAARIDDLTAVVSGITARAQDVATDIEALVARAAAISTKVDVATDAAATTLRRIDPLVATVSTVDAGQLNSVVADVVALLPALAALPPVIAKLAEQVDHLDRTVGEVSSLLQGVPGAARLVKRGAGHAGR